MGTCGCGDFHPDFKLPAPNGDTYFISLYDSCRDCATPAGIIIERMTPAQVRQWGAERVKPLPNVRDGGAALPVLDPAVLREAMVKFAREAAVELAKVGDAYDPDGLVEDAMKECFRAAVRATFDRWAKELKAKPFERSELHARYVRDLEAIAHASLNVSAAGRDEWGDYKVDAESMRRLIRAVRQLANGGKKRSKREGKEGRHA